MPTLYSDTDFGFEFWTCMGHIFPLRMGAFSGQDGSTFPPRPGSLFPPGLVHFSPPAWVHFFSSRHRKLFQFAGQNGAHFSKPKTASARRWVPSEEANRSRSEWASRSGSGWSSRFGSGEANRSRVTRPIGPVMNRPVGPGGRGQSGRE